jgi:hypothetical protein
MHGKNHGSSVRVHCLGKQRESTVQSLFAGLAPIHDPLEQAVGSSRRGPVEATVGPMSEAPLGPGCTDGPLRRPSHQSPRWSPLYGPGHGCSNRRGASSLESVLTNECSCTSRHPSGSSAIVLKEYPDLPQLSAVPIPTGGELRTVKVAGVWVA